MASTNTGTTGGVVDLPMIIAQINAANVGLEAIVDAVIDSTNVIVLAAKVKIAKAKLKQSNKILVDFVTSVSKEMEAILSSLDTQQIQSNVSGLVANPEEFQKNMQADPESAVKLLANKTSGVLEYIIGVNAAITLIGNLKVPGGKRLKRKLTQVHAAFGVLSSTLPDIITEIQTLNGLLQGADPKSLENILTGVSNMMSTLLHVMGYITLVALMTPIFAFAAPIALMGVYALAFVVESMVSALYMIGSPKFIQETNIILNGVKDIIANILKCMLYIATTIAAMMLLVILTSMVGVQLLTVFPTFILGLMSLAVLFGIMVVALKVINRMAKVADKQALSVLIHMLILSTVMVILAGVFMVLALVANMVNGNILSILALLGAMGLVLLAIMGFMFIASLVAPALAVGLVAVALVMATVMVLVVLTLTMALLVLVANILDPNEVISAVDKVLTTTEYVIQTILNKDFKRTDKKQEGGLIRDLIGDVFGSEMLSIFDLIVKISILFLTVLAVGVMMLLTGLLVAFVTLYGESADKIKQAPGVVMAVMDACATIIRTVLDSKTSSKIGDDDGLFLTLVGFVLGPDVVSIFRLLFKVVIIMLTIVVLLMVRVVMSELIWIQEEYNKHSGLYGEGGTAVTLIQNIMTTCSIVISTILNAGGQEMTEGDGIFIKLVSFVSPDLASILQLLFKVAIIALTMAVLAMIKVVLDEMNWLWTTYNNLGGDGMMQNMVTMTSNIMGAIDGIINILTTEQADPTGKPRSGLGKLLSFLGLDQLAEIVGLLCSFVRIGLAILALSVLGSVASIMKNVWDTYQAMGGDNIGVNATNMVRGIGNGINAMIEAMMNIKVNFGEAEERDEGKWHWKVWNVAYNKVLRLIDNIFGGGVTGLIDLMDAAGNIRAAIPIITALGAVADYINKTLKLLDDRMEGMRRATNESIPEVISLVTTMVNTINTAEVGDLELCDKNLQAIEATCRKISNTFNNLLGGKEGNLSFVVASAQKYNAVVKDTNKLINKINGLNINKLSALARMFGNAAAFAQAINGNFDKLADAINEKLAPILEGLQKTINDADQHIKEYTERQEQASQRTGSAFERLAGMGAQLPTGGPVPPGGANPSLQGAGQNKDVQAAAQVDITSQIESALRSFFRTNDGKILVSTT